MDDKKLKEEWNDLLFGVRRSVRYHTHRRKFFDRLGVWADFLVIVSGGSVVSFVVAGENHSLGAVIFGALTAIIGSFDLVIGFSSSARDHHDLARDFSELERHMTAASGTKTEKELIKFTNRRLEIEEEEPPILQVLNCYCHNELIKAHGYKDSELTRITFLQSFFKQWFDLFPTELVKVGDVQVPTAGGTVCERP